MQRPETKWAIAALTWFGLALGVYLDYRIGAAAVEQTLAEMRTQNAQQPDAMEPADWTFVGWSPRISIWLILPFIAAGFATLCGYWRIGFAVGMPAVAAAAIMFWRWYSFAAEW